MAIVAFVVFSLLYFTPGDPAAILAGDAATSDDIRRIREKLGLDQPFFVRFGGWVWSLVHGDLGTSIFTNLPVTHLIAQRVEPTLSLTLCTLIVSVALAVPLGVIAAARQNTAVDYAAMSVALLGVSIPNFVLGPLLVLTFSLSLFWFPPALWHGARYGVLPVITLSAIYTAYIARLTRGGMLDVLGQDYIRTARAKGLREWRVVFGHGLKPGILPVVSFLGPATAGIVTGAIAVEAIFAVPGLGSQLRSAAFNRDYTLVLGIVLFYALALMVLNLIVDVAYTRLDPRVQLG